MVLSVEQRIFLAGEKQKALMYLLHSFQLFLLIVSLEDGFKELVNSSRACEFIRYNTVYAEALC